MIELEFRIEGKPFAKQSFRFTRDGRKYQPAKVKKAEAEVKRQVIEQLPKDFVLKDYIVEIEELIYSFKYLKSFTKKQIRSLEEGVIFKTTKPDITDNLNKGLFDALEGIIYINDSRIISMKNIVKYYSKENYTFVKLTLYEKDELKIRRNK